MRIIDSLLKIYLELAEVFPKICKIFVVMFFCLIITKWVVIGIPTNLRKFVNKFMGAIK